MAEKKQKKVTVTRAEKKDGAKKLILEILKEGSRKSNEIIDEASKRYAQAFGGEDTENPNDVKGRIGSVLDVMKKEGEVLFEGGMYSLKTETPVEETQEKPKKSTRAKTKKAEKVEEKPGQKTDETAEEKPKKTRKSAKAKKTEEKPSEPTEEIVQPVPPAPIMPIAPVVPITPEVAPEPIPEEKPKKRASKKTKTTAKQAETATVTEEKAEEKPQETAEEVKEVKEEKGEKEVREPKGTLMDMSFLFGEVKPAPKKPTPAPAPAPTQVTPVAQIASAPQKADAEQKPQVKQERKENQEKKAEQKPQQKRTGRTVSAKKPAPARILTEEEKLQEAFLSKLRKLGGEYFEYYSVYLLERYSRMNGRRLEGLKITAGDRDGGIDGEIELTDGLGFRETIYIQAKNWNPDKGDEKLWVVGETLLQQFIGACVCRQAKDKKQHCRGIFITTSRFTIEARKILEETADKFVGYDGQDLFEAAKECSFGVVKKNGVWALDDALLAGEKAFFRSF